MTRKIFHSEVCTPYASLFGYLCNVKLATLILSLYILTLNAFPCMDRDRGSENSQTEVVSSSGLDHSHSTSDLCPPFCTCHCCHVHTVDFASTNFRPFNKQIFSNIFVHFDSIGEDHVYSLLDPPRV